MASAENRGSGPFGFVRQAPSTVASVAFVLLVLAIAWRSESWLLAVYALSFWHYPIYALTFVYRSVTLDTFKRDAVLMKAVSLLAFATVYLTGPPNLLSLVVVAIGLLFNLSAARALGTDRTYYGLELGALEPKLITGFPYSVMGHPMLLGNVIAFAGTLLDPAFRQDWWHLAVAHVALNALMIVMEANATPRTSERPALLRARIGVAAMGLGVVLGLVFAAPALALLGVLVAAAGLFCLLFDTYTAREPTTA